jgi:hypothetical protein
MPRQRVSDMPAADHRDQLWRGDFAGRQLMPRQRVPGIPAADRGGQRLRGEFAGRQRERQALRGSSER